METSIAPALLMEDPETLEHIIDLLAERAMERKRQQMRQRLGGR